MANTETLARLERQGASFLNLDFQELREDPGRALRRIFAHLGISVLDWKPILEAVSGDSQQGTVFARDQVSDPERNLSEPQRASAIALLQERGHYPH